MAIRNSKKAAFFTIISLILVISLVYFYSSSQKQSWQEHTKVEESRVLTMDMFIDDIEQDIERGLHISAMRSLIGMAEYMTKNGSFLTNFTHSFNEVMINGTVNNEIINITKNASFSDWIGRITDVGDKLNVEVKIFDLSLKPFQQDPWNVYVNVNGKLNLTDKSDLAKWNRVLNVTTIISIEEFEDPLYTVISKGKYINRIIRSNFSDFVSGNDASNLILHANRSWYISTNFSPSFLMRFSGNTSGSPYGIESIVNVEELQIAAPDIYKAGVSSVDYIYLGNSSISN